MEFSGKGDSGEILSDFPINEGIGVLEQVIIRSTLSAHFQGQALLILWAYHHQARDTRPARYENNGPVEFLSICKLPAAYLSLLARMSSDFEAEFSWDEMMMADQ